MKAVFRMDEKGNFIMAFPWKSITGNPLCDECPIEERSVVA